MSENAKAVKASLPIFFEKIDDGQGQDGIFTKVKCWLMHTGKNLNNSSFDKDVIEKAIPSLQYIPIVGFIQVDESNEKDFKGHEYILTKDENGIKYKYIGSAYGVILSTEDNEAHFETKMCDDGIEREFLVADGIVWNQFEDAADIFHRDGIKGHSIELNPNSIEGYEDDDGCFVFTKFSFRAACALGDSATPAMTGSTIEVNFTMSDFVASLQSELNDRFIEFTKIISDDSNQGGVENMPKNDFSQTAVQQLDDIAAIVSQYETVKNYWGDDIARYSLVDIQDDEAIVTDRGDAYRYFGFKFTMDGDSPKIDFACKTRKKVKYENYEEGASEPEPLFSFGELIEATEKEAFEKVNEANEAKDKVEADFEALKSEFDDIKPKYDDFVEAEKKREFEAQNAAKDAKFSEYEDVLGENADFVALKEKKDSMSVDEIEKECAVLYVKESRGKTNFTANDGSPAIGIFTDDDDFESEGYVNTRYGYIKKSC